MKNLKIYLYTDDVKIVDLVFGLALKRNIFESAGIEVIRKRSQDNLNSVHEYDLIFVDEIISDIELSSALRINSASFIRVIHNFDNWSGIHHHRVQDLSFNKLRVYFGDYLNSLAS